MNLFTSNIALNPLSCRAYKNVNPVGQNSDIKIDVDGSGPLKPFPVTCQYYGNYKLIELN